MARAKSNARLIYNVVFIIFISFVCIEISVMAQDAQSFYQKGYEYFSQGDYQKAEENYQKAIDLDQNFEDAHYWLGKVYRQIGQYDKAIPQWIEVLRINPRNPYAFRYLNESFRSTGRVQNGSAADYFNKGIEMLGVADEVFINKNQYNNQILLQVVPYFKKAIELKEDMIAAHYWLGEVYHVLSEKISWQYTSMAISSFEKAIQIEEENKPNTFQRPTEYWYSYQELMLIFQSLGLNERKEKLLLKMQEIKEKPYEEVLAEAGYDGFGYPDKIEIVKQNEEDVIELWKYVEKEKTFRVVNKKIVGEEATYDQHPQEESIIEDVIEKENVDDEDAS
jgi:tetratricopeptide (TPR) repeat protein